MKTLLSLSALVLFLAATLNNDLDNLSINKIQMIGSHASYKKAVDQGLFRYLRQKDSVTAMSTDFSHLGLSDQLSKGLLSIELDVYADTDGGRYAFPKGLSWAHNLTPYDLSGYMREPGFKVLHIPDIDFRSSCFTLGRGLLELKTWSDNHKGHYPIYVIINAKDEAREGLTVPERFTAETFKQLEAQILEVVGKDKIAFPDDLRGKHETIENAVLTGSWPPVGKLRGKLFFILNASEKALQAYIDGNASLKKRALFVNAAPGTPAASFILIDDPVKNFDKIRELVSKGYIVRTRADANTEEARRNDRSRFQAACESGAQIIATDYYNRSTHFKSDYVISFESGTYVRKNPVLFQISAAK